MKLSFDIARRYLFGKKTTNAINIITWISILGVSIGTMALILILSVFNGFEGLISGLFNSFNPDLKVEAAVGKSFSESDIDLIALSNIKGIEDYSLSLEETALFEYNDIQEVGKIKGVDENFNKITQIDSTIRQGVFALEDENRDYAVLGTGLSMKLNMDIKDAFLPITVYMPTKKSSPMGKDFKAQYIYPAGSFSVQSEQDFTFLIASLDFTRALLNNTDDISSIEIKLQEDADMKQVRKELNAVLGEAYTIKDRYQQDEIFLKIMNMEKWWSFIIVVFTLIIIAFNMIGCLWMIVLEKKKDIAVLRALGMTTTEIRNVILRVGMLITGLGLVAGIILATIIYILQKQFGLIKMAEGFIIDAYPVEFQLQDFIVVIITVLLIGLIASFPASLRAAKVSAYVQEK